MALPHHFDANDAYFEEAVNFFNTFQNLFNFENTKVLSLKILDDIDVGDTQCENVFEEGFTILNVRHKFMCDFVTRSERLKVNFGDFIKDASIEHELDAPLAPKKKHEVVYLAKEIDLLCASANCNTVVDFGSGLGYLDQHIFNKSSRQVLGIECNTQHYISAKKRQKQYHEGSTQKVKYKKHTVTESSDVAIMQYLREKFDAHGNVCLTGLHACADLTVDAMNLFLKIPDAKALILMPCCYHKMSTSDQKLFKYFPLSNSLQKIYEKHRGYEFLRVPFLRLAAQPSSVKEKLKDLVFNLLTRALLQVYADKYDYRISRTKRKAVKTKDIKNCFDCYIKNAQTSYSLSCRNNACARTGKSEAACGCAPKFNLEELKESWRVLCNDMTFRRAAIFILMQRHLQPIFENFILYDRVVYLQEKGVERCSVRKIVDETISPRCLALIINK